MSEDVEILGLRLQALGFLGTQVVGHRTAEWVALEPPPRARGEYRCECGHRTPLGTAREALRFLGHHQQQEVHAGAAVKSADGSVL
ncbi:MAG: hypothetical protein JWP11_3407 [Frankiales bacterium]|nr:hypothetical protein [Frankiales bacterium]